MIKKVISCALCLISIFLLSGCWSYIGLDELTIVSGFAIDKDIQTGMYKLAFEIIDLNSSIKEKEPGSKIIESEGSTIFDAIRNCKKKISNKLYFGHAKVVILSEYIAKNEDISVLIDMLIRDEEGRENIYVVVSQEKTASDILKAEGTDQTNISFEITNIVGDDPKVTSSTSPLKLYEIYNIINYPGISLAMPAFHNVDSFKKEISDEKGSDTGGSTPDNRTAPKSDTDDTKQKKNVELNGIAVFKNQRLVGYLTPEDSKCFLFVTNGVKKGLLPVSYSNNGKIDFVLEIFKSQSKMDFKVKNGKIIIQIKIKSRVALGEQLNDQHYGRKDLEQIEELAGKQLASRMKQMIKKVQNEYNSDIFGFGNLIYKKDPKLWAQLAPQWDTLFPELEVEIIPNIRIHNTALRKL